MNTLPHSISFIHICSFALVLLSACAVAVLSYRDHYNRKLLELKLNQCQMESRLSEQEHAMTTKALNAQILSLTSANEETHRQLATLKKEKDELAALIAQRDTEWKQQQSELEVVWLEKMEDILRAKEQETANLRAAEDVCTAKNHEIQTLTLAKDELRTICQRQEQKFRDLAKVVSTGCTSCGNDLVSTTPLGRAKGKKQLQNICMQQEQKIRELTDKLSECHSLLKNAKVYLGAPWEFDEVVGILPCGRPRSTRPRTSESSP